MMADPPIGPVFLAMLDRLADRIADRLAERLGPAKPAPSPLLDRSGIAQALGVSLSSIDRMVKDGCPCLRILDARRFEFEAVKAWLRDDPSGAMLTPKEAARLLSVSTDTLSLWRQKGTGPVFVKFSRRKQGNVRYLRSELERFIASKMGNEAGAP